MHRLRYARNALASISRLPIEMLVQVFTEYLTASDHYDSFDFDDDEASQQRPQRLATLSSVSSGWRETVQTTPSLWACLTSEQPLSFVRTSLERSKQSRISVTCSFEGPPAQQEALREICGEMYRWQSADLTVEKTSQLDVLGRSAAPFLKSLTVCATTDDQGVRLFKDEAPALQHISLQQVSIDWTSSILSGLRSIDLIRLTGPTPYEFVEILRSSPALTHLTLYNVDFPEPSAPSTRPSRISLSLLRTMEISQH